MTEYLLTDVRGHPIEGERYDDPDRAIDARARLMAEHEDGDAVSVKEAAEGEADALTNDTRVRKYLYLITAHPNEEKIGCVEFSKRPSVVPADKNEEGVCDIRDLEENRIIGQKRAVPMGYHDFDTEQDYQESAADVMAEKLREIDAAHLESAGVDPDDVFEETGGGASA